MLQRGLETFQSSIGGLDALLITHEHIDHIRSLPAILKTGCALVCSSGSARVTGVPAARRPESSRHGEVVVGDMTITMIPVSHDAAEPCGYHIQAGGRQVTIVTDLGEGSSPLLMYLRESDLIIIEANHDEEVLRAGPYPERLKRRILAPTGHLSNADAASLLVEALRRADRTPTVWLAHLSTTNNRPGLAQATVERALRNAGSASSVSVLARRAMSPVWTGGPAAALNPRQLGFDL
jgi:phosphoribosyl 1,2-cyclic phosphodiesterase